MLLDMTLDEALKKLEEPRIVFDEVVVPKKCPPVPNSPYRPGYDWLFSHERKLARFLEPWLQKFRHELIGEKGILSEALANAYYHGHQRNPALPIAVKVYLGKQGLIVCIKDRGEGFDVKNIATNFSKGKHYFHLAGNGLRLMITSNRFGIFYNRKGNTFHLLYLLTGRISLLAGPSAPCKIPRNPARIRHCRASKRVIESKIKREEPRLGTPLDDSVQTVVVANAQGNYLAAFNFDHKDGWELTKRCYLLLESAEQLGRRLTVGIPKMIWIQSPEGACMISRDRREEFILIVSLKEDANPALAQRYLPDLFEAVVSSISSARRESS